MISSVICTDTADKVHWQCELLEYSWSKVNQPGKLVRLVACDEDAILPDHRHAEVIRTAPSNVHPVTKDEYAPYNRLFSFQEWLDKAKPEGTVLILDPDCVFRKPLKTEVVAGSPIGQDWLDFGTSNALRDTIRASSDIDIDALQPVTWPALIDCNDLHRLLPRWIELTATIRQQNGLWESDMFAFVAASAELGLEYQLATTTAWMPWPEEKVKGAPLVHYCQTIKTRDNNELWGKHHYLPWEQPPDSSLAKLDYCRDLLTLLDEHVQLKNAEQRHQGDAIFIAIASYCEPELVPTLCRVRVNGVALTIKT